MRNNSPGRRSSFTRNAYDFRERATGVPEEEPPTVKQMRQDILDAMARFTVDGQRPTPQNLARMEAGMRERVARGQRRLEHHPEPVVYYMRVGNRIKIGYSTNLASRVHTVAAEELLGYEEGGTDLEKKRHRQFAAYRVRFEWFEDCQAIRDHIATLKPSPG